MVEFSGRFNQESVNALAKQSQMRTIMPLLSVAVIGSAMCVFGIISDDLFLTAVGAVTAVFMLLITFFSLINRKRSTMNVIGEETCEVYRFYDEGFTVNMKRGADYEGYTKAAYKYLTKVEESAEAYFLWISAAQAHVVKKADLTEGSLEELNQILTRALGDKFKAAKR